MSSRHDSGGGFDGGQKGKDEYFNCIYHSAYFLRITYSTFKQGYIAVKSVYVDEMKLNSYLFDIRHKSE